MDMCMGKGKGKGIAAGKGEPITFTTQQADGWPDVIMRMEIGAAVKIPNGQLVEVLREAGPAEYKIEWRRLRGTVKKSNLVAGMPAKVIASNPNNQFDKVFLWRKGVKVSIANGTSLSVARMDINNHGFFYGVIHDGTKYSVKKENVQIASGLVALPKVTGMGKAKGEVKGVTIDTSAVAAAAAACIGVPEDGPENEAWLMLNGSVLESALSVVESLGEAPVRLVDARFFIQLAKMEATLPRRQEIPEQAFLSLRQLKRLGPKHLSPYNEFGLPIAAISHAWQQVDHPDPKGINLKILGHVLSVLLEAYDEYKTLAVFMDFTSVCQKGRNLEDRTPKEWQLFDLALTNMMEWYAHPEIHTLKITKLPDEYPDGFVFPNGVVANLVEYFDRGWCFCESSLSNLIKKREYVLDLGELSKVEAEPNPLFGSPTHRMYRLRNACCSKASRQPPLTPDIFNLELKKKSFTSRGTDFNKVSDLYKMAFETQMGAAERLVFKQLYWGPEDITLLLQVFAAGATPNLTELSLYENRIGDASCIEFAQACAAGALRNLSKLDLAFNYVGDEGLSALAQASAAGAFPNLSQLDLRVNCIGKAGLSALAKACAAGAFPKLSKLELGHNCIGNKGLSALLQACSAGALPKLGSLNLTDITVNWKELDTANKERARRGANTVEIGL